MTDFTEIRATPGLRTTDILFTAGATMRISAPPSHVFNVITDLENYGTWNKDTPQMALQGPSPLQVGSKIQMKTIMADQNREYDIPIEILKFEIPGENGVYALAWRGKMLLSWFATSERVQEVHPVDGEPDSCEVCNFESMAGWGAYVFKYAMGIPEQMGRFNAKYLGDLKIRAEQTYARH